MVISERLCDNQREPVWSSVRDCMVISEGLCGDQ